MNTDFNFDSTKALLHDSNFFYMISTDVDGNYSYINTRYASSFGFINPNFIGQPYYITMHPDDTKVCEEVGALCYANPGKLFPATIRKHNGQGGYVVTQWEFTLIVEHGEAKGIFCIGYDITEYVRAKSAVIDINRDLETKNELLEAIAFEQSHIVRAPLANIVGLVAILKNMELGPNLSGIVNMLEESAGKLDDVVKNIVYKI
jgi:PAS domain S-box-containing protein